MLSVVKTWDSFQQLTPVVALGSLENLPRRPLFDDATDAHDDNILAHQSDNLDVMAYEQIS